jgi:hypothetical protein
MPKTISKPARPGPNREAKARHLHQHEDGKHQADAGQGLRPQETDEIGLCHSDKRLHDQHHDGRQREPSPLDFPATRMGEMSALS